MSLFKGESPNLGSKTTVFDTQSLSEAKPLVRKVIGLDLIATSLSTHFFIADRPYQVVAIREVHSVVGSTSAAAAVRKVTADLVAPGASAGATCIELQASAFDLTAAINTKVADTLSTTFSDLQIAAGDRLSLKLSGTLTGLVGYVQVELVAV